MLTRKEEQEKGTRYEQLLKQLVSNSLLEEFVHVNPHYFKNEKEKLELSDLLIEDGVNAIILQLKTSNTDEWQDIDKAHRWIEKNLKKAKDQGCGASKSLFSQTVISEHPVRGTVSYLPKTLKCIHILVVVTCNGESLSVPSELPSRSKDQVPIQYFDFDDFVGLCDIVKTLPDLLSYLEQRSRLATWGRPSLARERDAYAHYITHAGQFDSTLTTEDFKGAWRKLTIDNRTLFEEMLRADEEARLYYAMLTEIRRCTEEYYTYRQGDSGEPDVGFRRANFEIARKLNSLRLVLRRGFCARMREKLELANTSEKGFNFFSSIDKEESTGILFLASREPRSQRQMTLETLVVCLSLRQKLKEVIGIATENGDHEPGRSTDFIFFSPSETNKYNKEDIELCGKLFKDFVIESHNVFPSLGKKIIRP